MRDGQTMGRSMCVRFQAFLTKDYLLVNIDRVTTITFHGRPFCFLVCKVIHLYQFFVGIILAV